MVLKDSIEDIKKKFGIIGLSQNLNMALGRALLVADTDLSVLLIGENGTGKESFSKIIHSYSSRRHNKFIVINCGAIPVGTIDSELFGHEKGSFTDAIESRKGYFEEADKGTIFLDEIGEMPLETQSKLLRVLENKEIIHVGSSNVKKVDIRVIAATNKDLQQMVYEKKFREDLFYRLNTVQINIPALRERGDDLLLLFVRFATDFAITYKTKPITLTDDAKMYIYKYSFPGNIRQLKNIVESMSVFETNKEIDVQTLKKYLPKECVSACLNHVETHNYKDEMEFLYKIIIDLKKDNNDLKKFLFDLLSKSEIGSKVVEKYCNLFSEKSQVKTLEENK